MLEAGQYVFAFAVLAGCAASLPQLVRDLASKERGLLVSGVVAALVLAVFWPTERHSMGGHLEHYEALRAGSVSLLSPFPALGQSLGLRLCAWVAGVLGLPSAALLWASAVSAGIWTGCLAVLAYRATGRSWAAAVVLILLILDDQRLLWSHSAFNVASPTAAIGLAAVFAWGAGRAGCGRLALAAALWAMASVLFRYDSAAHLPATACFFLFGAVSSGRPPGDTLRPILIGVVAFLGLFATFHLFQGQGLEAIWGNPRSDSIGLRWRANVPRLVLLGSWASAPSMVAFGGLALLAFSPWFPKWLANGLLRTGPRRGGDTVSGPLLACLALCIVLSWVVEASFDDMGHRHMLVGRGYLAVLAVALSHRAYLRVGRLAFVPLVLLALQLASSIPSAHGRYFASGDWLAQMKAGRATAHVSLDRAIEDGCTLVAENVQAGGVDLFDALLLTDLTEACDLFRNSGGCVLWLRASVDEEFHGVGRWSRVRKVNDLWSWVRLGEAPTERWGEVSVYRWWTTPSLIGGHITMAMPDQCREL